MRSQTRAAIGASESDFVLIYWGYIYPGKGIETLLHACEIVFRQDSNVRLVLVGGRLDVPRGGWAMSSSDYFQMVQQLAEKLNIAERLTWTGQFQWDSDAGSRYLHAGDACVLPFNAGVTLNNSSLAAASTHGLPVIGTELPEGQDEVLQHGRNIYLCRPRDPERLAEAILSLKENALLRERLRAGAIRLAQDRYQPSTVARRLSEVLKSAVASRHGLAHQEEGQQLLSRRVTGFMVKICICHLPSGPSEKSMMMLPARFSRSLSPCTTWRGIKPCSLVHQTLKDIEIIAVNDASTDNSLGVLQEYQARYPQLRVLTCAYNKGLASVRNIGLRAARGRYIAFLDGDDWADIRMGEVMVRDAIRDDADVVIADVTVSHEDSKSFGPLGDHHVRGWLPPRLRTTPFDVSRDPRILLLEPVAWPKIYKRSFLSKHDLHFEAGMNSYEDICFHFSVLLKAARISLMDDALFLPAEPARSDIGRTDRESSRCSQCSRRFGRTCGMGCPADIWAMLVKVQVRQFDWLLRDRVQSKHKREFFARVKEQFRMIPAAGFEHSIKHDGLEGLAILLCMRRNWLQAYETLASQKWPVFLPCMSDCIACIDIGIRAAASCSSKASVPEPPKNGASQNQRFLQFSSKGYEPGPHPETNWKADGNASLHRRFWKESVAQGRTCG